MGLRWLNLLMHISTFIGTIMLLADVAIFQRLYQKKIRSIELTDQLTGGDNTRSFLKKMGRILADSKLSYALIALDTNKFKLINDKYGVDKANELLRLIHRVLTSRLGQECIPIKYSFFFDFHTPLAVPAVGDRFDAEKLTDQLLACGVDFLTCHARCNRGHAYYDTQIGRRHPHLHFDLIRQLGALRISNPAS